MDNLEIWSQLCDRHPRFRDPDGVIKLRARGLRALLDQAYACGLQANPKFRKEPDLPEGFDSLFGGFNKKR